MSKNFSSASPKKVKLEFHEVVPTNINGYGLVKPNKLISSGSNGQRPFH